MMEEHFMRGWAHGHERLSADLDLGLAWLRAKGGRFVESIAPDRTRGDGAHIVRPAAALSSGETQRIRAAKQR